MIHPSIRVYRELYCPSSSLGVGLGLDARYTDATGRTRIETLVTSVAADNYRDWQQRISNDNGRTWSPFEDAQDVGRVEDTPEGGIVDYPPQVAFDPHTGRRYRFMLRAQWPGQPCYTYDWAQRKHPRVFHMFLAEEDGPWQLVRYEQGADFDPDNPFDPAYLYANQAYPGNAATFAPDGTCYYPMNLTGQTEERRGIMLIRRDPSDGQWKQSDIRSISPELSSRSLMEAEAAVLEDHRILIVSRGSNTETTPGRKWKILSEDGGKTLGPVEEFHYDDGTQFYSPSSIHRFMRSSRNGKLYWFANISPEPPAGNWPRYPLFIAEIDEQRAAVRKNRLIMLDTCQPGEPERTESFPGVQFSNFCLLENRESLDIEIYITLRGLYGPEDRIRGDVYRYVFSPHG